MPNTFAFPIVSQHSCSKRAKETIHSWQQYVNQGTDDSEWNSFMRHLIVEFAAENLCCILEMIQFKQQFVDDVNFNEHLPNGKVCGRR